MFWVSYGILEMVSTLCRVLRACRVLREDESPAVIWKLFHVVG